MLTGKTESGFEFEIEEKTLGDWEVIEKLVDLEDGRYSAAVSVLRRILGEDQYGRLKDHCRDENTGKITTNSMLKELSDILNSPKEEKNS